MKLNYIHRQIFFLQDVRYKLIKTGKQIVDKTPFKWTEWISGNKLNLNLLLFESHIGRKCYVFARIWKNSFWIATEVLALLLWYL